MITLEVTKSTFDELVAKLQRFAIDERIMGDAIDMHGISLVCRKVNGKDNFVVVEEA